MKIQSTIEYQPIKDAKRIFEKNYKNDDFLKSLEKKIFLCTLSSSKKIIKDIHDDVSIITLTTQDAAVKVIASTDKVNKIIKFNKSLFVNDFNSMDPSAKKEIIVKTVRTLMHEYIHTLGYNHFDNTSLFYNQSTVPYKVAKLFVAYLKERNFIE